MDAYATLILEVTRKMGEAKTTANRQSLDRVRTILNRLEHAAFPCPILEHRFAAPRLWRFDFAWPDQMLALEYEGGAYTGGRHTRGSGFTKDAEKYNAAAARGWAVIRVTREMVTNGAMVEQLAPAFALRRTA